MIEADSEAGSAGMESDPATPSEELPHRIEVPEPPRGGGRQRPSRREDERETRGVLAAVAGWVGRHRLETGVFAVTILALTTVAVYLSVDPGPSRPDPVITVGPPPGQDLQTYVETRRRALEDIAGENGRRRAVVTFRTAMTAAQLESLSLPAGVVLEQVIVGDHLGYPESVEGGPQAAVAVERWRENRVRVLDAQRRGLGEVLAGSPSPEPAADWYRSESVMVERALGRVNAGSIVLGAMVEGTGDGLVALQADPSVLLVDLAPPGVDAEKISFRLVSG